MMLKFSAGLENPNSIIIMGFIKGDLAKRNSLTEPIRAEYGYGLRLDLRSEDVCLTTLKAENFSSIKDGKGYRLQAGSVSYIDFSEELIHKIIESQNHSERWKLIKKEHINDTSFL